MIEEPVAPLRPVSPGVSFADAVAGNRGVVVSNVVIQLLRECPMTSTETKTETGFFTLAETETRRRLDFFLDGDRDSGSQDRDSRSAMHCAQGVRGIHSVRASHPGPGTARRF